MSTYDSSSGGYLLPPNFTQTHLQQLALVFHIVVRPWIAEQLIAMGYTGLLRDRLDEIEDAFFSRLYAELDDRQDAEQWRNRGFPNRFWLRDLADEHCGLKLDWNPVALAELVAELTNEVRSKRWATDPNAAHQLLERASQAFSDPRLQRAVPLLLEAAQELGLDFTLLRSAILDEARGRRTPSVTPMSLKTFESLKDFVRLL